MRGRGKKDERNDKRKGRSNDEETTIWYFIKDFTCPDSYDPVCAGWLSGEGGAR